MRTIVCPVRRRAALFPDEAAVITSSIITNAHLDALVTSAVVELRKAYVGPGDRILVDLTSPLSGTVLMVALARIGATMIHTGRGMTAAGVTQLSHVAATDRMISDRSERLDLKRIPYSEGAELVAGARSDALWDLDAVATLVSTSGSSGIPRLAALTVQNHVLSAAGSRSNISLNRGDSWLLSLPLNHVSGQSIIFRSLLSGAAVAIPSGHTDIAGAVNALRPTHISVVDTQLSELIDDMKNPGLQTLSAILAGGGPIRERSLDRALELRIPLFRTYGLTEMASQVTTTTPGATRMELATSGKLLPNRQLRITNEGEITVKGDTLFAGFVEAGQLNRNLDSEGWYRTSDCGYLDGSGRLVVTGRRDNMFISGGENIHPEEIERVLMGIPAVQNAAVAAMEDARFGRRPIAFVKLSEQGDIGQVAEAVGRALPAFKRPDRYFGWLEGLETPLGKIDRTRLQLEAQRVSAGS